MRFNQTICMAEPGNSIRNFVGGAVLEHTLPKQSNHGQGHYQEQH